MAVLEGWLSDMDSNHDKGLQRALCYHYTIGQTGMKIAFQGRGRKENLRVRTGACPVGILVLMMEKPVAKIRHD